MNPNYGYQLYQTQRAKTRAEVLADDARRGHAKAAVIRKGRRTVRATRALGIMATNAAGIMAARVGARTA